MSELRAESVTQHLETVLRNEDNYYFEMLMPSSRWNENPGLPGYWRGAVIDFYSKLYDPVTRLGDTFDFLEEDYEIAKKTFATAADILQRINDLEVSEEATDKFFKLAMDRCFPPDEVDEFYIGGRGAEGILKSIITNAKDLIRYTELAQAS